MYPNQLIMQPFVFIIDSPSHSELYDGYGAGMALQDSLRALRIHCTYTLTTNSQNFQSSLINRLSASIQQIESSSNIKAVPFIHLCMPSNQSGIFLTDGSFLDWAELRNILQALNYKNSSKPYLCMSSVNGFNATNIASEFDSVFSALIGNNSIVNQSEVIAAYISFYYQLFYKQVNLYQAVQIMRYASGNENFYYALGEDVKNHKFAEILSNICTSSRW